MRGDFAYIIGSVLNERVVDVMRRAGLKVGFIGKNKNFVHPGAIFDHEIIIEELGNMSTDRMVEEIGDNKVVIFWSTNDKYVELKALLSERLGVKSQSVASALNIESKDKMREKLMFSNSPYTAWFKKIESSIELEGVLNSEITFPVILKPTNLAGSKYVFKCSSVEELKDAIDNIPSKELFDKFDLIIEEYLDGEKFSVEGYVADGFFCTPQNITRAISANEIGIDDFYEHLHIVPSGLESSAEKEVQEATAGVINDLGLDNCPIHAEFIMTSSGPRLIEIASRWGGLRETLYLNCYGYSLFELEINFISENLDPKWINGKSIEKYSVSRFLYPQKEGSYIGLSNVDLLGSIQSSAQLDIRAETGQKVGLSKHGFSKVGTITLTNNDREVLSKDLEIVNNNISVIVE